MHEPTEDGFAIEVIATPPGIALGRITVGGFVEHFRMGLSFWSADDYRRSWHDALARVTGDQEPVDSCLVASITDPVSSNFIECWPLYRRGDDVFVQNALIFLAELDEPFDPARPWRSVAGRSTVDEDGERVSEWRTTVAAVRRFLTRRCANP